MSDDDESTYIVWHDGTEPLVLDAAQPRDAADEYIKRRGRDLKWGARIHVGIELCVFGSELTKLDQE